MDVHWLQAEIARAEGGVAGRQVRPLVEGERRAAEVRHPLGEKGQQEQEDEEVCCRWDTNQGFSHSFTV